MFRVRRIMDDALPLARNIHEFPATSANCTPSRAVLACPSSTYCEVSLRRSSLRAARSDAHLALSLRGTHEYSGLERRAIAQVQAILRSQFWGVPEADVTDLPTRLTNPLKYRFRTLIFVAENSRAGVKGFAMVSHNPGNRCLFLDYMASGKRLTGTDTRAAEGQGRGG